MSALPQPRTVRTVSSIRELVGSCRSAHQTVALVPTMGNLHAGHLSLAQIAAEIADKVVLSIFVNPTQFGPDEDFAAYPRTFDEDWARVRDAGTVDAVFVPDVAEIYPFGADQAVRLTLPPLAQELCGATRPGHFDGVATVVCRLLNIVAPDLLVLGQKDYQQFILMQRMVADLRLPVSVISGPIQREADGLAMSSRNRYLTTAERQIAPALHAMLQYVRSALRSGASDYSQLQAEGARALAEAGFRPDYVEVRRLADLAKPTADDRPDELVILAAGWLGHARLIDNLLV